MSSVSESQGTRIPIVFGTGERQSLRDTKDDVAEIPQTAAQTESILVDGEAAKNRKGDIMLGKEELPPLSPAEHEKYDELAVKMEYFHNHFRQTWRMFEAACTNYRRPAGMTLKQFLDSGLQFCQHLTMHHHIEETYVFPMLARKMPEFRIDDNDNNSSSNSNSNSNSNNSSKGGKKKGKRHNALLRQHDEIHAGLVKFQAYLRSVKQRETELDWARLHGLMEPWGGVLWTHLDEEVKTLRADNMRRYWTLEEIRGLTM